MNIKTLDKARYEDLPARVRVDISPGSWLPILLPLAAIILFLVAGMMFWLGYHAMRPEILCALAFASMLGGKLMGAKESAAFEQKRQEAADKVIDIEEDEIPDGSRLSLEWVEFNTVAVSLVKETEQETMATA